MTCYLRHFRENYQETFEVKSNNASSEEGDREIDIVESGDPNTEVEEDLEQCNLAPLWLSSNQDSIPGFH